MYLINYECYECNHKFQDAWSSIVDAVQPGADPVEEFFNEPLERCRKAISNTTGH